MERDLTLKEKIQIYMKNRKEITTLEQNIERSLKENYIEKMCERSGSKIYFF